MEYKFINLPHINANDTHALIVKINFKNGQKIKKNQEIIEVETTKTNFPILSENDGYIYYLKKEKEEVITGEKLAIILKKKDDKFYKKYLKKNNLIDSELIITKKASELIKEKNLSLDIFKNYGTVSYNTVIDYLRKAENNYNSKSSEKVDFAKNYNQKDLILVGDINSLIISQEIFKNQGYNFICYSSKSSKNDEIDLEYINIDDIKKFKSKKYSIFLCREGKKNYSNLINYIFNKKINFVNCIHQSAIISKTAQLGLSNLILPNVVIGPKTQIGSFCKILTGSTIAHHGKIEDNVTICDGCNIGGNVKIKNNAYIGIGVKINKRIDIGNNALIITGKTVIDSVEDKKVIKN